jgi:hypothetical protein
MFPIKLKIYLVNNFFFRGLDKFFKYFFWIFYGCDVPAPRYIKEQTLIRHGIREGIWLETGTYFGQTTKVLSKFSKKVITIEADKKLFENAKLYFGKKNNIELCYGETEKNIEKILKSINTPYLNIWLDAHYSFGLTYLGENECPTMIELGIIQKYISKFKGIRILIDDVRCFPTSDSVVSNYPNLNDIINWAKQNKMRWGIEHDILFLKN